MEKIKKMIIIGLIVSIVSQVYINLFINDFRISLSVIVFSIFLLSYKKLSIIKTSVMTGTIVFIFRSILEVALGRSIFSSLINFYPVIIFYIIYGIIFKILKLKNNDISTKRLFIGLIISDFFSNIFEIVFRYPKVNHNDLLNIIIILFLIGIIRTTIILIIFNLLKFYKLFIIKREDEERYKNLLLTISSLKSEIYLMKKNANYIEGVMKNSYKLYEELMKEGRSKELKDLSLLIATDVHEIKKDYQRVITGIEGLFLDKLEYNIMELKDIFKILEDSTLKLLQRQNIKASLTFSISRNFKTVKHYQLISVLRNLINNSIEGLDSKKNVRLINVIHLESDENHIFEVIDNGIGIKESDIDLVFKPGYSTKFNTDTGDIYRGLGLTYVKDVVCNYFKGDIILESSINKGSKLRILIPKDKVEVGN